MSRNMQYLLDIQPNFYLNVSNIKLNTVKFIITDVVMHCFKNMQEKEKRKPNCKFDK